jgi:broad specificity phosphatase PhoE
MLWLVRHAPVELRVDEPASTWPLTDEGRAAAEELARALPPISVVRSSPEPKAIGTAEPIARASGVEIELDERLREVGRAANFATYDAHREAVRSYLAGEPVDGWEPHGRALERVRDAVVALDDAAVVSHGMLLSLLLGYSFEQWNRIALPDVIEWQPEE